MAYVSLPVIDASAEAFSRFGRFVASSEGFPLTGDASVTYREKVGVMALAGPVSVGVLNLATRGPQRFHELERHVATPELLVAVEGDVAFAVAPANQPAPAPDLSQVAAFRLRQGQAVIMRPGVWHGLPFPLGDRASLLVVFQEGTPDRDFQLADTQKDGGTTFTIEG